jgi:hypothetical protein
MIDRPAIATPRQLMESTSRKFHNPWKLSVLRANGALLFGGLETGLHTVQMTDNAEKPILTPAEQNPWYLLATLYGVPEPNDREVQNRNRTTWNRYYASRLTDDDRRRLKGRVTTADLEPMDEHELADIQKVFVRRSGSHSVSIPTPKDPIKFEDTNFESDIRFSNYIFSDVDFSRSVFNGLANFRESHLIGYSEFSRAEFGTRAIFGGATFAGDVNFRNAKFYFDGEFRRTVFSGDADFGFAIFLKRALFANASFEDNADFRRVDIHGSSDFNLTKFSAKADFERTFFGGYINFNEAKLLGAFNFSRVLCKENINFYRTEFSMGAQFDKSVFSGHADFSNTSFTGFTILRNATFHQEVNFTNSELKAPTDFTGCNFGTYPPQFPGAKLHEGTVWRKVSWPRPPTNPDNAGVFTDAYERLKLEMDRLKKHEDELMFFAKELECRRVAAGQLWGLHIGTYGILCNYGRSFMIPVGWLLALIVIGAVQFWPVLGWDCFLSLGVSTANVLGPFGLRKELVDPEALKGLSRWFQVLTGAQMVLGPVLLFLIGLGLRNRFRMK